ncbi:nuclear transport factor 2 family protein [Sediminicoccus sp. KRV36]|uniref:nuclear transport factor 2 family protein n=1 Tax=Sediminicoccus sp. KRV36 TaxID=3133721 RepID=UPI00200CFE78|nr:nuclear transport factor 2 family protein [Sediminicoccus rosea]UPY36356.1 nuclear transport factor 2 family protein [Sediminicoccus rosea]
MSIHRRHLAGAAILAAAVIPSFANAQSADDQAVSQAVAALTRAMLAADRAALEAVTHEGLSYGHSAGRIENRAQFIANLVERNNPFGEINITNQTIQVNGDDAIVRHVFTGNTTGGGRITPVNIGILQVWKKQGGAWKLYARQAFTRPQA